MNKSPKSIPDYELYNVKYKNARLNLLLMIVMTVVNVVILCFGSDRYFVFSATIPYFIVMLGMLWTGRMPDEYYVDWENGVPFWDDSVLIVLIAIAAVIIATYLLCFLFSSKNRIGWLIAAAVFFAVDTLGMVFLTGISADTILDVLFHAWVLYYLIAGTVYGIKLKKLPEPTEPVANPIPEVPTVYASAAENAPTDENKES
jgi:hypothetical protein